MRALVYTAPKTFEIKDVPRPEINSKQVLIKVKVCGVCKTDIHIHNGGFIARFPLIPGHEFAGVVEEVGEDVDNVKVGDSVTADNTVLCGRCYYCVRDKPLFCKNFESLGCTTNGGYAEYVAVNSEKVFKIKKVSYEEAALTEPTACVIHAIDTLKPEAGDEALVFGAGPAGLILAQALKNSGVSNLVLAAPTMSKLELGKKLGADEIVQVDRNDYNKHKEILRKEYPEGFDIVVDATGVAPVVEQCIEFTKYGAKVLLFGVCKEDARISMSPYEIYRKEIKIIGTFAQTHCFPRAVQFLENGRIKVKELITLSLIHI